MAGGPGVRAPMPTCNFYNAWLLVDSRRCMARGSTGSISMTHQAATLLIEAPNKLSLSLCKSVSESNSSHHPGKVAAAGARCKKKDMKSMKLVIPSRFIS